MSLISLMKRVDPNKAGFHVVTQDELEKIHSILTLAMKDIADVCEREGINWSLFGGSALGAIRHNGFIPWDDDIDLYMTRKDFAKFKDVFEKYFSEKYELKIPGDKDYLMHYPQIYIVGTVAQLIQSTGKSTDRLFIDVFIMESTFDNVVLRYIHGIFCTFFLFVDSVLRTCLCANNLQKCEDGTGMMTKELRKRLIISKLFKFYSLEKWLYLSDKCFSLKKKESKYVVCPSGSLHFFEEMYLRDKMCNYRKVKFESLEAYMPYDYQYYLNKRYGENYMTPPSADKQEKHVYVKLEL